MPCVDYNFGMFFLPVSRLTGGRGFKNAARKTLVSLLAIILVLSQGARLLSAASLDSGVMHGVVRTIHRAPLADVEMVLVGPGPDGGERCAATDELGRYRFIRLEPGTYALGAKKGGYVAQIRQGCRVSGNAPFEVDIFLSQGGVEEGLVPTESEIIDLGGTGSMLTVMPHEYLSFVPSGRHLAGQLSQAVGIRSESAFGASEILAQSFRLEGFSLDSPETGALAVNLDYDALEEITVSGPGVPAESGEFSGAVVDVRTRSGAREIGGLFTLFMQLPEWHNPNSVDPEVVQNRFEEAYGAHFSLGGPLVTDRLWFFTAGRAGYWKEFIDDWPPEYSEWGNAWNFLGKVTWAVSSSHRLSALVEWDRDQVDNVEAGPFTAPEAVPFQWVNHGLFGVTWEGRLSPRTQLELRLGAYFQRGRLDPQSEDPPHLDLGTGILSGNSLEFWEYPQERYSLNASLNHWIESRALGRHGLKAGLEGEIAPLRDYRGIPGDHLFLDIFGDPNILIAWGGYDRRPETRRLSLFLQDSWTLPGNRIVLDAGIRLSHVRGYLESFEGAAFAPRTGIAPRLGFVWDLGGDHRTLLKGHYGKYFHGARAALYMNLEAEELYQEYFWDDGEWVLYFEDPWEEYIIDPNLRMPFMRQYVLGLKQELSPDLTAEVAYIERTHRDFIDRVNLSGDWIETRFTDEVTGETFPVFERLNPGENRFLQTNPSVDEDYSGEWGAAYPGIVSFTPIRRYRGLALSLNKRFSRGWQLHASYVYSRSWGSDDNIWGEYSEARTSGLGASLLFSNPNYQINAAGRLTIDPTHALKISGSYQIPGVDVVLGLFYSFASGETYSRHIWVPDGIDPDPVSNFHEFVYILGEERGAFRYPSQHNLDLRLEKFFSRSRFRLGFMVDIFNVFNSGVPTWVQTQINPWTEYGFGQVLGIRFPRSYRVGFRFGF